jgi:hypothetical protein
VLPLTHLQPAKKKQRTATKPPFTKTGSSSGSIMSFLVNGSGKEKDTQKSSINTSKWGSRKQTKQ